MSMEKCDILTSILRRMPLLMDVRVSGIFLLNLAYLRQIRLLKSSLSFSLSQLVFDIVRQ